MKKNNSRKMIGFFGGSFNPIHLGHINLALELKEICKLDEVWFCPAWINPHKQETSPASIEHRLNMVNLAIEDLPDFRLLDWEAKREKPSYTVDTLQELIHLEKEKEYPNSYHLILGSDAASRFMDWHQPEKIIKMVPLLIGQRANAQDLESLQGPTEICDAIKKSLITTRMMDISSTTIRERINKNLYCKHLITGKVLDYIYRNGLYYNTL